jgi:hypothetical protein
MYYIPPLKAHYLDFTSVHHVLYATSLTTRISDFSYALQLK